MASLNILYSNPLNLKNKITKIEHKKIFCGPSKILKNISWSINICLKHFVTLTKILRPLPPPTYFMCAPLCLIPGLYRKSECSRFFVNLKVPYLRRLLATCQSTISEKRLHVKSIKDLLHQIY